MRTNQKRLGQKEARSVLTQKGEYATSILWFPARCGTLSSPIPGSNQHGWLIPKMHRWDSRTRLDRLLRPPSFVQGKRKSANSFKNFVKCMKTHRKMHLFIKMFHFTHKSTNYTKTIKTCTKTFRKLLFLLKSINLQTNRHILSLEPTHGPSMARPWPIHGPPMGSQPGPSFCVYFNSKNHERVTLAHFLCTL